MLIVITHFSFSQNFTDTKGELQISASGTAVYTLPIATPPSIKNTAPIINLVYSSGVKGGIAGQGWSINSISAISRMAARLDIDGFVDGVDFDDNDKLALDGQRLLLKTGTYWANGSTYETEYKSNTRIELKIEGSVTYFIVTAPDGSRSWYGSKGSGSLQNSASINSWYIVRYEDVDTNFIDYNYKTITYYGSDQLYIDTITFSGNVKMNIPTQNKISFIYWDSKRFEKDYIKGLPVYNIKILQRIEVYADNDIFRTYKLSHIEDKELGYQRLEKITEINARNEESNPVIFAYAPTSTKEVRTEKKYINNLQFDKIDLAGDFDGDGRLDFIANNKLFTNLFSGDSGNAPITLPAFDVTYRGRIRSITTLTNNKINQYHSILAINELTNTTEFKVNNLVNNSLVLNFKKIIYFDNYMPVPGTTCPNCEDPLINSIKDSNKYYEGDFNGDGISEILIESTSNEVWEVNVDGTSQWDCSCDVRVTNQGKNFYLLDMNPNSSTALGSAGFFQLVSSSKSYEGEKYINDFNGDGKSDILIVNPDKTYKIISFKQLTTSPWSEIETIGSGILDAYSKTKQMLFGDFNGDGKTDIMLPDSEGGEGQTKWHIYYSNGNPSAGEFFTKESHDIVEYRPDTTKERKPYDTQADFSTYYAIDINGDGKSDLVRVWRKYYKPKWTINDHNTKWQVTAFSNTIGKTGEFGFVQTYDSNVFDSGSPDIPIPLTSNYKYNGANTDLVLVRGQKETIEYYQFNKNVGNENRLISVTESNGNIKQTIEYKAMESLDGGLGNAADFYSSANSVSYPNIEIIRNPNSYLVSKLIATINGVSKYQDFRYRGFVSNFNFGTVGFTKTTRSSWYLKDSDDKLWTTQYNDPALRGANTFTWTSRDGNTVFNTVPTNLVNTKTNEFAVYTKGGNIPLSPIMQNNILITDQVTKNQNFIASNSITASSAVKDNLGVNYQAVQIVLKPGFSVKATDGSIFKASPSAAAGGAPLSNSSVYNILLTKQTVVDHLADTKTEISYTYDGTVDSVNYFGLETKSTTKQFSGSALQGTTIVSTQYENNPGGAGAAYYVGRPKKVNTSTNIYTGDTRTAEEIYTYTGSNLTKTEKKGHNTYSVIEDMTYDAAGNLLTKKVSAPSAPVPPVPRLITDEYDATKRFVVKKTDHQKLVTTFDYNTLGQVKESKDYLGVVSSFTYDNWGKLKTTTIKNASETALTSIVDYNRLADGGYTTTTTDNTDGKTITQYDVLGRIVKTTSKGFAVGSTVSKQIVYDGLGRKTKESEPYFTSPSQWTVFEYDYLLRPVTITAHTGKIQTFKYEGLKTTSNDDGKITTVTVDALGNKTQTTDPGGAVSFVYYANGQLKESNYDTNSVKMVIDGWGNKIEMTDPNAGTYKYSYDAFGQIKTETTPNGTTAYEYDDAGKLIEKTIKGAGNNSLSKYTYNAFNLITESSFKNIDEGTSIINSFGYDSYKRISKKTETTPYAVFVKELTYDTYGRTLTEASAASISGKSNSKKVKLTYQNGFAWQIILDDATQKILWQTNSLNERGKLKEASLGNGIAITNNYDIYGYASQIKADRTVTNPGNVMTLTTLFEPKRGNLINRTNNLFSWNESFIYDELDRLLTYNNELGQKETQTYDIKGRISKNNVGTYDYPQTGKTYQTNSISLSTEASNYYKNRGVGANSASKLSLDITYNTFKSPVTIKEQGRDGNYIDYLSFTYNDGNDRSTMFYGGSQDNKLDRPLRKHYSGDGTMEIKENRTTGAVEFVTYIGGDGYSAPLVVKNDGTTQNYLYLHRDYQGTIVAVTDNAGAIVEKRLFDAWGGILKVQNGSGVALTGLTVLDRDYTGHEHLQSVGIINMNGRLYDPKMHRFLQPDNFIQDPANTQNYNRYGYVLNNPLKYIDPSGEELISFGVAVCIGAIIAATTYTLTALLADVPFNVEGLAKATFIGAASAAVTYGIGSAAGTISNFYIRAGVSAVAHGAFQGTMTSVSGGKFWSGFAAGALSSIAASAWSGGGSTSDYHGAGNFAKSGVGMVSFGTVSGGVGAQLTGGNFWQGAATGLVVSGLNHYAHKIQENRINSIADESLINSNYDPDRDISQMDEISRDLYVKRMRTNVDLADILYNDAGNPNIKYDSAITDYGKYINKEVTIYAKAFTTNRDLFLTIMHEGLHAWDYHHGLMSAWGSKSRAITETRAYEMMHYLDNNVFNNADHSHFYNLYNKMANQSGFNNFSIKNYPIFFNNIQR